MPGPRSLHRTPRPLGEPGTPEHEGGAGSPLLLVHGIGGTWRVWRPVLPALERHHHVIAPSLLGHDGALPLPVDAAASVHLLVDALEADLDARGLDRLHVVGNSLGGWVALELARRGRARSVTAFSPAGAWTSTLRVGTLLATMRAGFILGAALAGKPGRPEALADSPRARRALLGVQVADPDRMDHAEIAEGLRAIRRSPGVLPLLKSLIQEPFEPLPSEPDRPIRLVWPERDQVLPFRYYGVAMARRLPGVELVRMAGIGHVPMSDDPQGITDRILEVTRRIDQRDAEAGQDDRTG